MKISENKLNCSMQNFIANMLLPKVMIITYEAYPTYKHVQGWVTNCNQLKKITLAFDGKTNFEKMKSMTSTNYTALEEEGSFF